jgi:hypothetical protein
LLLAVQELLVKETTVVLLVQTQAVVAEVQVLLVKMAVLMALSLAEMVEQELQIA